MKKISKYRKAVFIVTYRLENNNPKYFLLKRKLHWKGWEFPKGGVETFELKRKTVKRELKEETGQDAKKIKRFMEKGNYVYHKPLEDRPGFIGQSYRLFSAEITGKKANIDKKEHSSYIWLDYKKALMLLTWPNQKKCLKIVNKWLMKNK